jgi:hypothetical protein
MIVLRRSGSSALRSLLTLCSFGVLCLLALPSFGQDQKGAGITMTADADAKDIGLPLYPGARRHKDKDSDTPGVNLGLWGSGSGFKLAVLKMESDDSIDKVADYYKRKLAKYGKVLDCSNATAGESSAKDDKQLTCADDKPDKGGLLFKSGTKADQHIVSVQPAAHGSLFQLVHVAHWEK